jgi:hypothetical protein
MYNICNAMHIFAQRRKKERIKLREQDKQNTHSMLAAFENVEIL